MASPSASEPAQTASLRAALGIPWRGAFPHPTLVMGIVNVTPDSFQTEGRHAETDAAVRHARRLIADGADLLDIGGESTRPGAETVPVLEEKRRVLPVIEALAAEANTPLSIDTRKAEVARAALSAGARIVNDVSAGRFDGAMFATVAEFGAFLCLMHAPPDPATMGWSTGNNPTYTDVLAEVRDFLLERGEAAEAAGVARDRLWIDPGFGFGKSVEDNLALLQRLAELAGTRYPVLVGTSRKSTLGRVLDDASPNGRINASVATAVLAIQQGAAIVRAHDVAATVEAARTADAVLFPRPTGG
jgi:dihydropteroate synthase